MLWNLLALGSMFGGTIGVLRRAEEKATQVRGPTPRDWAERPLSPAPHWATGSSLDEDIWAQRRPILDHDEWAGERYTIDAPPPVARPVIPSILKRKKFILESLDGGESTYPFRPGLDVRRRKVSPNNGRRRIGRKGPDGRIRPIYVDGDEQQ